MNVVVLTAGKPAHRYVVNNLHARRRLALVIVAGVNTRDSIPRLRRGYWSVARRWGEAVAGDRSAAGVRRDRRRLARFESRLLRRALLRELGIDERYGFSPDLHVETVSSLNAPDTASMIEHCNANLLLLLGCPIVRPPVLTAAELGALNLHTSILPAFRGCHPEHWILLTGRHDCAGVTVHWATDGLDAGDIVRQQRVPVRPGDNPFALRCRCLRASVDLLAETIDALRRDERPGAPQVQAGHVYRSAQLTPELRWMCYRGGRITDAQEVAACPR